MSRVEEAFLIALKHRLQTTNTTNELKSKVEIERVDLLCRRADAFEDSNQTYSQYLHSAITNTLIMATARLLSND